MNVQTAYEAQGRMPQALQLKSANLVMEDTGLLDVMLKLRALNNDMTVERAREDLLKQINEDLSSSSNALLKDLGQNLEVLVNKNSGTLEITITPQHPLSAQQISLYGLFKPQELGYNISVK